MFKGILENGKKTEGKDKEFYDNGKIKNEVEYINGEWSGKGKEYSNINYNLIHKCEHLK